MSEFPPLRTCEEIQQTFETTLAQDGPDRDQRREWARQLGQFMVRITELRYRQARGRNFARLLTRLSAGVTAVVTTITGSTLLAHVRGPAATALGFSAVILGGIGAVIAATRPGDSYAMDVVMAARYEHLWWDMYGFGTTKLPTVSAVDFSTAWAEFVERQETISSSPASAAK
jgi:hypothetical protein